MLHGGALNLSDKVPPPGQAQSALTKYSLISAFRAAVECLEGQSGAVRFTLSSLQSL